MKALKVILLIVAIVAVVGIIQLVRTAMKVQSLKKDGMANIVIDRWYFPFNGNYTMTNAGVVAGRVSVSGTPRYRYDWSSNWGWN